MPVDHQEIELKRLLRGPNAIEVLLAALGGAVREEKRQTNHIFDTSGRQLFDAGYTVRLREETGPLFLVTVKGPSRALGSHTGSKPEAEAAVDARVARDILSGAADPVGALRSALGNTEHQKLFAGLDAVRSGKPLVLVGRFDNVRKVIPVTLPGGLGLDVEVDETQFPDGHTDHEVEIEIPSDEQVGEVEAWLSSTLQRAGVEHTTSSPKLVRFYSHRR
jgi:uncharacterized protein YjbK